MTVEKLEKSILFGLIQLINILYEYPLCFLTNLRARIKQILICPHLDMIGQRLFKFHFYAVHKMTH